MENSETVKQKSSCGRFREVVVLKGYNCSDLAGKMLVLLIGGCLWKVVEHGRSIAIDYTLRALSKNQNWIAWPWPDQSFWQAISFIRGFSLKSFLLHARYLWFDWCGWIVLIKSEILITTWIVWPSSSGKWKAPLNLTLQTQTRVINSRKKIMCNSKTTLVHSNTWGSRSHNENTTKWLRLFTNVTKTDNG